MDTKADMFAEINKALAVLEAGGVILYPTDTIWGLGCDATNSEAVQKIFDIKQRASNKSVIILLPDAKSVLKYVATPPPDIIDIIHSFQTPTTIVYENGVGVSDKVLAEDGSIGIRVTSDPFCKTLLRRFGKPIVSTSANISGKQSPLCFKDIDPILPSLVAYTVQYRQDDDAPAQPSAIWKIDDLGNRTRIR